MGYKKTSVLFEILTLAWILMPASAQAQSARITNLADEPFGTITNFSVDQKISQNVCAYQPSSGNIYNVTATGSGSGGGFTLSSGANTINYEVQWSDTTGKTTGTALVTGVALNGQTTNATQSGCTSGPGNTASLITILRTAMIGTARSGSYTGVLSIILAPN